ncbi:MAG: beta-N-acetylglucosaminidase domain-containing protein [Candidatus Endonucleobacter bathymodioli]|uniref:Beta-N-acetylglucosaminidase domain-containing protein n=1 Tax=Candidatus Endonucleibacter bathymodioli TaxID=539814 RepID=A0AA90STT2_9GAMM|nr:beta-N-acetylglucosaminidase domain-containing protein [Candidatus Endonucleobacter bathymodioli]
MSFAYGVIEGFYDQKKSWNCQVRHDYVDFCERKGFGFFIYAPKNDPFLREQWRDPWPEAELENLKALSHAFQEKGMDFGIGFTPFEVHTLDNQTKGLLRTKLALINSIKPTMLSILFDDFCNDIPNLAKIQSDIAEFIACESNAEKFQVVGTYYSRDQLLTRTYGPKPEHYWAEMGAALDPQFEIFWTGDHVISMGYDESGLARMTELFQRKPFIWDNYPVNDPTWLKQRLRIYSFTGRPWRLSEWSSGHAVNPMIQPRLSMIPLATLADIYRQKDQFSANESFKSVLHDLCGNELANTIQSNLLYFTEMGGDNFTPSTIKRLKDEFGKFDDLAQLPYTKEVLAWLDGISGGG